MRFFVSGVRLVLFVFVGLVFLCGNGFAGWFGPSQLPPEAKNMLDGKAYITPSGYFKVNIYNGNTDWTVEELIVNISEPDWFMKAVKAAEENRPEPKLDKYKIILNIPPLTNKAFSISVNWDPAEPYEWNIWNAYGDD